ncbi:MAG: ribosome-binding protein aMBF1 (putative translation factor) [Candidatus Arcticimaribacter sp.]|jgi:ribosome-binding protein aMBF1 (putative translation factor)
MIALYTSEYFKSILPEQLARIITKRREYLNISQRDLGVRCHLSENIIKKM